MSGNFYQNITIPDYEQIIHCMHCGLCLPECPTYVLTGLERHSPRGRIRLIKSVADGELEITDNFIDSINFCLDCQACVTACPAGVQYGQLVESARYHIEAKQAIEKKIPLLKKLILKTVFRKQLLLRLAGRALKITQILRLDIIARSMGLLKLISKRFHEISYLTPTVSAKIGSYPVRQKMHTKSRNIRVGILTGCVQDVFFSNVNRDTIEVLQRNGYDVVVPKHQNCCGSVHGHNGDLDTARLLAKQIIDQFEKVNIDYVAVNAAGCGSFMKHYDDLLQNDREYLDRARNFVSKVKDISELLMECGWDPPTGKHEMTITYHDPCHLAHAQKVTSQPRTLLQSIPGIHFKELPESTWCCGSAGIYNITHFDTSVELLERKMNNISKTGAEYVVTGNPGCIIQLIFGTKRFNQNIKVIHPVTLLNDCYRREGDKINDN